MWQFNQKIFCTSSEPSSAKSPRSLNGFVINRQLLNNSLQTSAWEMMHDEVCEDFLLHPRQTGWGWWGLQSSDGLRIRTSNPPMDEGSGPPILRRTEDLGFQSSSNQWFGPPILGRTEDLGHQSSDGERIWASNPPWGKDLGLQSSDGLTWTSNPRTDIGN